MSSTPSATESDAGSPESAKSFGLAGASLIGLALGLIELAVLLPSNEVLRWRHETHTATLLAVCVVLVGLHGLAVATLMRVIRPRSERVWRGVVLVLAAAFGWGWQDSIMHGDGIRAFAYYDVLRVVAAILGPTLLAAYVWVIGWTARGPRWLRPAIAVIAAGAGAAATQLVLIDYDSFHGYLVLFVAANLTWVMRCWLSSRAVSVASWAALVASLAAVVVVPGWMSGQRATQRFSEIPAALLSLPWTRPLQIPPESVLNPDASLSSKRIAEMRRGLTRWKSELTGKPRGRNVLLVVLESTRADSWADPEITPRFHKWKSHGTYVPRAVAQYPATPLAYGAMFTSQPPSVLTQTPAWAETRLFDRLSKRFDHLFLTRPHNRWFDKDAITDFFVPEGTKVLKHKSVSIGLRNLKKQMAVAKSDSFFAWVHIYEPHQPWKKRKKFEKKPGKRGAYESEVALVDHHLGAFMGWFYEQPFAAETLVIVIADHGEGMGEKIGGKAFWGHHVHVRNVVSHVPAFFSGPGVPKGETREIPISQLDVMPTMFDFLGEELPEETLAQGRSLFAVLEDPTPRDLVTEAFSIRGKEFFEFVQAVRNSDAEAARKRFEEVSGKGKYAPKIALQHGRYKLIRDMLVQDVELYDVVTDPNEEVDLAESEPERLAEFEDRLAEWRAQQSWVVHELER